MKDRLNDLQDDRVMSFGGKQASMQEAGNTDLSTYPVMIEVTVALEAGYKLLKWIMELCTPGPPKAINDIETTAVWNCGDDAEKSMNPEVTKKRLKALQIRGP